MRIGSRSTWRGGAFAAGSVACRATLLLLSSALVATSVLFPSLGLPAAESDDKPPAKSPPANTLPARSDVQKTPPRPNEPPAAPAPAAVPPALRPKFFRPLNPAFAAALDPARAGAPHLVRFASDRTLLKRLTRAKELLAKNSYAEAARSLQVILDAGEDSFFHPEPDDPAAPTEADPAHSGRSLKLEAQQLLGRMPPAGRESYELQFGTAARQMLDEAVKTADPLLLSLVSRRYFHTQAGYDATYRLATDHLDHARPRAAGLCFERLRNTPAAKSRFEPMLSLKAALAWQRAGMESEALHALLELKRDYPLGKVTVGGREVALFGDGEQALAWLSKTLGAREEPPPATNDAWPMVRGDAARNASTAGSSPYLNRGWHAPLFRGATGNSDQEASLERLLADRRNTFHQSGEDRNLAALPSAQPLIVGNLVLVRGSSDTRAYSLASGKLVWATAEKDKILLDLAANTSNLQSQPPGYSPLSMLLTQRAWRDATFGTLSSDGEFVYVLEDTGFVGPYSYSAGATHPLAARDDNRLVAYDVRTGRAAWETGGPRGDFADALAGTFFLGPPLVLGKRLYCLAESSGEIRLLALEARSGKLDWSQTLVLAELNLLQDPFRRQSGLSPSYADGVLVCPTEAGAVVAIDPGTRQLLWGYRYPNVMSADARLPRAIIIQQQVMKNSQGIVGNDSNRWLDPLATLAGGRVLLSPRDGNELHCLNALDGALLWKRPRGEGLYVGGVHDGRVLVVGRSSVEALQMADGAPAWTERTLVPMPSGRGLVSGGHYHLPLTSAEVAMIDFRDGRIVTRSKSREGRIPGNLAAGGGFVIAQATDAVDGFQQVESLEAEVTTTLKARPLDAAALAMRGEIFLQRGKVQEAYADLKQALELNSADVRVREVLLGSLLEGLRVDFATYRRATGDIERLLTEPEQRLAYLRLMANGLERLGEKTAAFDIYLRFTDPLVPASKLERVDSGISVRYERLVRARSAALYQAASPEQRAEMNGEMAKVLEAAREKKTAEPLRRLLSYFGELGPAVEARRELVELLATEGNWLEAERWLRELEEAADPAASAWASARLAGLLIEAGRPADALPAIRRVMEKWSATVCLAGKTGAELTAEWKKNPDIARELAAVSPWPLGLVEAKRVATPPDPDAFRAYKVPVSGHREPFFNDVLFQVDQRLEELRARDQYGREMWKLSFDSPSAWSNPYVNRAYTLDHFVLMLVGTQIVAVDTLGTAAEPGARILWQQSLIEAGSSQAFAVNQRPVNLAGGVQQFIAIDSFGQPLGTVGPVTRDSVCLQRGRKLLALDRLTGETLWTREDVIPGSDVFGDEEFVFVVPPESESAIVFKALDGTLLGQREVLPGNLRLGTRGRAVIGWSEAGGKQVLKLKDAWSGNDLWKHEFAAGSRPTLIDLDEAAVLEPNGRFAVIKLADGKLQVESMVEPGPTVYQIIVFRSPEQYTLIANVPFPASNPPGFNRYGSQSVIVSGMVYGLERMGGKKLWATRVDRQAVDLLQPANLPILTFACQYQSSEKKGINRFETQFELMCLDKRNGRVVYREKQPEQAPMSVEISADPDTRHLEVKLPQAVLELTLTDKPIPKEP